jgi:hypothetical protein
MYIDGPVADDHFIAPDLVEDLVAEKNTAWFQRQQV